MKLVASNINWVVSGPHTQVLDAQDAIAPPHHTVNHLYTYDFGVDVYIYIYICIIIHIYVYVYVYVMNMYIYTHIRYQIY